MMLHWAHLGIVSGRENNHVSRNLTAVIDLDSVRCEAFKAAVDGLAVGAVDCGEVSILEDVSLGHEWKVGDNLILEMLWSA